MEQNYILIDKFFKSRVKTITWIVFSLILLVDVAAVVCFVLFPDYWGVELLGFLLFTAIDVIYVLLNGLFYADKFGYRLDADAVVVRRVIATEKVSVYRKSCIEDIFYSEKSWRGKKYYNVKFTSQCGNFSLKYLLRSQLEDIIFYFEETYDESIPAE